MTTYDGLRDYLNERNSPEIRMSFGAVDELITGGLPKSAHADAAWWTADERVWLEAGYEVRAVDLDRRMVTFAAAQEDGATEQDGPELDQDGLPVDDELRMTWELAAIGPIGEAHVRRFVGGDAAAHLATLLGANLLDREGDRYTVRPPAAP